MASRNEKAEIDQLRQEVDALTADRISPAVLDSTHRAMENVASFAQTLRERAAILSDQIRSQPIMSMMIVGAIGFVVARVIR